MICKFAALRNDTHIENIGDHIMAKATLAKIGHFGHNKYGHNYGNMGGVSKCGQNADQL